MNSSGVFQTLGQSLHQEAQQAILGVERLQQQLDAKVEKDNQVVGALTDQCGTLSCLMSKERMEFSTWRKDFAMRHENGEKSLITLSAEMRDTCARLSDRMSEHFTAHTLRQPSPGIPPMSAQREEIRGKQEAELDLTQRAVKNHRLREVEWKQASVSVSLDNIEDSGHDHWLPKPLEQRVPIADHMLPNIGAQYSVDHVVLIDDENLGSSFLDLSTAVGSPSPSCDYSRSTCSPCARGRISSASASVRATAPSFCARHQNQDLQRSK